VEIQPACHRIICDYLVSSSSLIWDRPLKMIELFGYFAWRARAIRCSERKDIPSNWKQIYYQERFPFKFIFRRSDRAILSRAGLRASFMKIITNFLHVTESVLRNRWFLSYEEIPQVLLYLKVQYHVHNSRPQEPVQSLQSRPDFDTLCI
jgi:hypothetical protein